MFFTSEGLIAIRKKMGFNKQGFSGFLGMYPHHYNRLEADTVKENPTIAKILEIGKSIQTDFSIGSPKDPKAEISQGSDLESLRLSKGLSFAQAELVTGVSEQSILKLEKDRQSSGGRLDTILKLAKGYGVHFVFTQKYLETIKERGKKFPPKTAQPKQPVKK